MRHVSIFGDDLETLNGLGVADYIVQVYRSVLFYPRALSELNVMKGSDWNYHGKSYDAAAPLVFALILFPVAVDEDSALDDIVGLLVEDNKIDRSLGDAIRWRVSLKRLSSD